MPINPDKLQTLNLSARQLKEYTNWGDEMVNEWLNFFQNIIEVAIEADSIRIEVDANTLQVSINVTNIQTNTDNIQTNTTNITDHIALISAHGVTGDNVGNEDFCTDVIGGVVNLMALVATAVDSTATVLATDIAVAPASYDQTYTNTIATLANETKEKHNTMLTDLNNAIAQINELIANSKTAKQMAAV